MKKCWRCELSETSHKVQSQTLSRDFFSRKDFLVEREEYSYFIARAECKHIYIMASLCSNDFSIQIKFQGGSQMCQYLN